MGRRSAKNNAARLAAAREPRHALLMSLLFGVLYFLILSLSGIDTIKTVVLILAALTLVIMAFRRDLLRERLSIPFLVLALFVLMDGISTFYAPSGKFALREFLKVLCAFCLALCILCVSPRGEKQTGNRAMGVLAVCAALGSLVSIDLLSTRFISGAVLGFLGLFTEEYKWLDGVEAGVRMTSMFTNPNVFAGYSGIGVLLSLGLAVAAEQRKARSFYLVLLYVNALAFILAFSLGASAFIAAAFLVFIFLLPSEKRGSAMALMVEALVLVGVSAFLISATSFQAWEKVQPIPLLCTAVGAAALCGLDLLVGSWVNTRVKLRKRSFILLLCAVLVFIAVFLAAAWNLTGEATLAPGQSIRRALYLDPGEYTMEVQSEGKLTVIVESQNRRETMMHTYTRLYSGSAGEVSFTVPEGSLVQYFSFIAPDGARISSAYCGDSEIPLDYKLLPDFIANRLQGLLANQNAIQRMVFIEDGLKLFRRSPVIGLGMGVYENGIKSVQSFYYETKYAHDHYIQVLAETGVVGLILFLGMLILFFLSAWRSRRTQAYAPVLGAALVFMAGHAVVEVVFSTYAYLPMAFGVFALTQLCCGDAVKKPAVSTLARNICMGVTALCIVAYGVLLACNMAAMNLIERQPTMGAVEKAVKLDKFEWADYALAYVTNAMGESTGTAVRKQADAYAERLSKVDSNTIPLYLAQYYFTTNRLTDGLNMLEKYVDYVSSDSTAWQNAFNLLRNVDTNDPAFGEGVLRLADKLEAWNAANLGNIQLDAETRAFVEQFR